MPAKKYAVALLAFVSLCATASAADIRGVIARIDPDKKEIILEVRGKAARGMPTVFTIDKDTRVTIGQQAVQLTDLAPGKHVHVTFENRGGKPVALSIHNLGLFTTPAAPTAPGVVADENTVVGTLQRVALTDKEIVVVGPGEKETTFQVPDGIKITKDDKALKLEELKEGEHVAVRKEKKDGKLTAASIQVVAAEPMKPSNLSKLRQVLQLADQLLQMAEQKQGSKP